MSSSLPTRLHRVPVLLTGFILVAACTSLPPPATENSDWEQLRTQLDLMDSWELSGRVNIRYDGESHTPRIRWMQQNMEYHIRLWGSFNAGNTQITGRPGFVTLEQGNDILSASSPEELILQQLGYELPVSNLRYWIKGVPAPDGVSQLAFNELNQLASLEQAGWTVDFTDYRQYEALTLPRRVELTRPENDIRLRFIGLSWLSE